MKADTRTEAEVLATADKFNEAFVRKSIEDALGLFAEDSDLIFIGSEAGETAIGYEELKALLSRVFARRETYFWEWKWRSVSTAGSVAWLTADAAVTAETGGEKVTSPYRITIVLEKRGRKWFWMHFHGSEPVIGHT